ncbi:hypothetical protein NL676_035032 [Syzygium grande]|nr:hypothetical protein NL676_035032 [Syzygium grande]
MAFPLPPPPPPPRSVLKPCRCHSLPHPLPSSSMADQRLACLAVPGAAALRPQLRPWPLAFPARPERSEIEPKKTKVNFGVVDNLVTDVPLVLSSSRLEGNTTSAMMLSGVIPKYIMPEYNSEWGIAGSVDVAQVEKALSDLENEGRKAVAVLVTSPYLPGYEILDRDHGIVCELVGSRYMTFALNLGTHEEHVQRLVSGIKHLSVASAAKSTEGTVNNGDLGPFLDIEMAMSPRDAFFVSKRKASIEECPGKICGELICPYPPGIPLLIPGEIITERALDYLMQVKKYGTLITGASDPLLSSLIVCNE